MLQYYVDYSTTIPLAFVLVQRIIAHHPLVSRSLPVRTNYLCQDNTTTLGAIFPAESLNSAAGSNAC